MNEYGITTIVIIDGIISVSLAILSIIWGVLYIKIREYANHDKFGRQHMVGLSLGTFVFFVSFSISHIITGLVIGLFIPSWWLAVGSIIELQAVINLVYRTWIVAQKINNKEVIMDNANATKI